MSDETTCSVQRSITDTVINGSIKETFSLTVDAKTETAVFKRLATLDINFTPLLFHGDAGPNHCFL